jgi:hypothetical protein
MPTALRHTKESKKRLERLIKLCEGLPEVEVSGETHVGFKVRKKTFGYYLFDHHGDGRVALCVKVPAGKNRLYLENAPERFFTPSYLGSKGWVGLRLDGKAVDWGEVEALVKESYRQVAPKGLVIKL